MHCALLLFGCTATIAPQEPELEPGSRARAERNAAQANEALRRCEHFVAGWLAEADTQTGLIPTNLRSGGDLWTPANSAADNYPFMVLTSALTDRPRLEGALLAMLRKERQLTTRHAGLPDDWSFSSQAFRHAAPDLDRMLFGASEYVKDGLLPLTEWLGESPWSERMTELVEAIWAAAKTQTEFGLVPTANVEVHGEMLQTLSRIYWMQGERHYLDWALRLGDHYLLGPGHPTRGDRPLRLRDHGCEVVSGLCELYVTLHFADPERKERYREPLHEMLERILEVGRNEHGLFVDQVHPLSGEQEVFSRHGARATDTFGYTLNGYYAVYLVDGTTAYRDAVRTALGALWKDYRSHPWEGSSSDGYADAIEGALNLYNREPLETCAAWIDSEMAVMWTKQQESGVIEGWHGDGNFARTSLMYALWKSQGVTAQPWRADLRLGAARQGDGLLLFLTTDAPWSGRLVFDRPRHRDSLKLPLDWPRINQFPEWFTVETDEDYQVRDLRSGALLERTGESLLGGLPLQVTADAPVVLLVRAAS